MIAKYLLFGKDFKLTSAKLGNSRLTENDCGEHFPKPLFIEDVIFSVAESIQKKNMVTASFVLRKYGLF